MTLLLLEKHVDWGVEKIDNLIKGGVIVEALDGPAARITLNQLNKYASPYVPDDLKKEIQDILDAVIIGDTKEMAAEAVDLLEHIVNTRLVNIKPTANEIIIALLSLVKAALDALLEDK